MSLSGRVMRSHLTIEDMANIDVVLHLQYIVSEISITIFQYFILNPLVTPVIKQFLIQMLYRDESQLTGTRRTGSYGPQIIFFGFSSWLFL